MSEADFSQQEPQKSPESILDSSEGTESPQPDNPAIESTPITSPDAKPIERFEQRITDETAIAPDSSPADLTKGRPRLKEADWFSLARKLRQRNRDLLQKVALLEENLAKTQEALETETSRSRSIDALNSQQSQEISLNQEKIRSLYAELEASHQATQRQNSLNADLSAQLRVAQNRIEELEQEYTHLHHHYQQQTHQLQEIKTQSQELSVRLQRQQRQTLQFKAALDKCLAAKSMLSGSTSEAPIPPTAPEPQPAPVLPSSAPIAMKAQPIQPWSSRSDEPLDWASVTDFSNVTADVAATPAPDSQQSPELSELEQNWREFSEEGAEIVVSAFDDLLEDTAEDIPPTESNLKPPTPPEAVVDAPTDPPEASGPVPPPPSPIVYPQRPTKKRKSLAAIELPSFPRYEPS